VQVHGSRFARVGPVRAAAGFAAANEAIQGVDALITDRRHPIAVMFADCVPVALADPARGRVVVVHAGWRGIAAGIVAEAAGRFERPADVRTVIGPAIGLDHYEVGQEVMAAVSSAMEGSPAMERRSGRVFLDLASTVARILRERGIRRIERADLCTACSPERFYSYRRDGETGRHALIAARLS
jgi:YfiH family protein